MTGWYAAKQTTRAAWFRAMSRPVPAGMDPQEVVRHYLNRSEPYVSMTAVAGDRPPPVGAKQFPTRAAALEAARVMGVPGRRVAVAVRTG